MKLTLLCIGDIVGRPGRRVLAERLKAVVQERSIDCVVANAENAAGGSGLTPQIYEKLLHYGVHLITLGDHAYRKRAILETLEKADNIAVPANLSEHATGHGYALYKTAKGPVVGVIALIGRLFMKPAECPYGAADRLISRVQQLADKANEGLLTAEEQQEYQAYVHAGDIVATLQAVARKTLEPVAG